MTAVHPLPMSPTAQFRLQMVSAIEALRRLGYPFALAVDQVADTRQQTPKGTSKQVSTRTLYRWHRRWRVHGPLGLEPAQRRPLQGSRVIPPDVLEFLHTEHLDNPGASIPELIRRARHHGLLRPHEKLHRQTVWRAFKRMGVPTAGQKIPKRPDVRPFAFAERMQMVLVDGCHFRAGPNRARRVALYFLDDATRYGLEVLVCKSEHTVPFLKALRELISRYGLMDILYCDNGSGFVSSDARQVLSNLGVLHVSGTPRYPQGRGKIERFNRAARARVLNALARPDIDPEPAALTIRLRHDLLSLYNHLPHEGLKRKTPAQSWSASPRPLRACLEQDRLQEAFLVTETRRVRQDNTIPFGGQYFEVPAGYSGTKLTLYRKVLAGDTLHIRHHGRLLRLHTVNYHHNAHDRRVSRTKGSPATGTEPVPPPTASLMDFDRHYGCVLDAHGGFSNPEANSGNPQKGSRWEDEPRTLKNLCPTIASQLFPSDG